MAMALTASQWNLAGSQGWGNGRRAGTVSRGVLPSDYCASVCAAEGTGEEEARRFSLFKTWKIWYDTDRI